jgi:hypothetical protein
MPPSDDLKVNGQRVPWVVILAVVSAGVGYGILLGQVMQIDARLARVEAALQPPKHTHSEERKPDAPVDYRSAFVAVAPRMR